MHTANQRLQAENMQKKRNVVSPKVVDRKMWL